LLEANEGRHGRKRRKHWVREPVKVAVKRGLVKKEKEQEKVASPREKKRRRIHYKGGRNAGIA